MLPDAVLQQTNIVLKHDFGPAHTFSAIRFGWKGFELILEICFLERKYKANGGAQFTRKNERTGRERCFGTEEVNVHGSCSRTISVGMNTDELTPGQRWDEGTTTS